jgi:hypothetical protein
MLAIDLFCGLGGWAEGFLAEGYDVIGFDIERRPYPAQLVLQNVLTLHGSQFRNAAVIVASPPCQAYSYRAMPWKRAKALPPPDNSLFEACFRIQCEAIEATGKTCKECGGDGLEWTCCPCHYCGGKGVVYRYIPLVVENVKGAQPWVGRAKWHYGSFYLWGDVPALMPLVGSIKNGHIGGGPWFAIGSTGQKNVGHNPDGRKVQGFNFHEHEKTGKPGRSFQSAAVEGIKHGGDWFSGYGGGFGWDHSQMRQHNSKSPARKAASAQIAKIPFPLAQHIAQVYKNGAHSHATLDTPQMGGVSKGEENL